MQGFAGGNQGLVLTLERHFPHAERQIASAETHLSSAERQIASAERHFPHAARLSADDFKYISILLPTDSTK
jgi:hypothetical protein